MQANCEVPLGKTACFPVQVPVSDEPFCSFFKIFFFFNLNVCSCYVDSCSLEWSVAQRWETSYRQTSP